MKRPILSLGEPSMMPSMVVLYEAIIEANEYMDYQEEQIQKMCEERTHKAIKHQRLQTKYAELLGIIKELKSLAKKDMQSKIKELDTNEGVAQYIWDAAMNNKMKTI